MKRALVHSVLEAARSDHRIVFLTADLGFMLLEPIKELLGKRFINVGIAEPNMIGIAAGLASEGYVPFVYSMAQFVSIRCLEHIRVSLCQNNRRVILIGVGAGYTYGAQGPSHHAIEDIGAVTALPNINMIVPSDDFDVERAITSAILSEKSTYIRIGNAGSNRLPSENRNFCLGKIEQLIAGDKIAFISIGGMVSLCKEIIDSLRKDVGIGASLYNSHTLKPFDYSATQKIIKKYKIVYTVEENVKNGGLGSIVAHLIAANSFGRTKFRSFTIKDEYKGECGDEGYLKSLDGLSAENITKTLMQDIKEVDFVN